MFDYLQIVRDSINALTSFRFGERNLWLVDASIAVIIKLIQLVAHDSSLAFTFQVGTVVFERIKVLGDTRDQLMESRIILRASSENTKT